MNLEALEADHRLLCERLAAAAEESDPIRLWRLLGISRPEQVPDATVPELRAWRDKKAAA